MCMLFLLGMCGGWAHLDHVLYISTYCPANGVLIGFRGSETLLPLPTFLQIGSMCTTNYVAVKRGAVV